MLPGLKVLVVDDSFIYRKTLHELVSGLPFVTRADVARDGGTALERAAALAPDVITLDIDMPDMSGLEVLRRLRSSGSAASVVIVSAYTTEGSKLAAKALELGAVDVVPKPTSQSGEDRLRELETALAPILAALAGKAQRPPALSFESLPAVKPNVSTRPPRVVAIGASTGGPAALSEVLGSLRGDLPVPVVVALHMPHGFTHQLAEALDRRSAPQVREGRDGERLRPGTVYLAPGGSQMRVERPEEGGAPEVVVTDDPPERNCKPSVDYLFRSVAEAYGRRTLGVILTGMGDDGARGLSQLKRLGARVVAQDKESSVVFGMPGAAIAAGVVDDVVPLADIARHIEALLSA